MDPDGRLRRISVDTVEGGAMRRLGLVPLVLCLAAAAAVGIAAADGGPSPGTFTGGPGVLGSRGEIRYVALGGARTTTVAAVRVRDGRVLRYTSIKGWFGVPLVANDGSAGGLSADGRTLVLATWAGQPSARTVSRFAVLATRTLRLRHAIVLRGSYSFDAISPDGSTMYLIQYLSSANYTDYRVRAYDLAGGELVPGAIVDKREPAEQMQGSPVTRAPGRGGSWAYTLYSRSVDNAFVHALDTAHRSAVCVDLPWRVDLGTTVRMSLSADGTQLVLRQPAIGLLAQIDTTSFRVKAFHKPVAPGEPVG
jgi:hypothetical protein